MPPFCVPPGHFFFSETWLSRRLTLRYTPDVAFLSDTSMAEAQVMTDLMRKTAEERGEAL